MDGMKKGLKVWRQKWRAEKALPLLRAKWPQHTFAIKSTVNLKFQTEYYVAIRGGSGQWIGCGALSR